MVAYNLAEIFLSHTNSLFYYFSFITKKLMWVGF